MRPLVLACLSITVDGKISPRAFAQFASPADRRRLLEAKAADAILSGHQTPEADDTGLSAKDLREARRAKGLRPNPIRVIVSDSGRVNLKGELFGRGGPQLVVFSTSRMPERLRSGIARRADLFLFAREAVDLSIALQILRSDFGVKRLVCEGGEELLRALAERDLVDGIRLTVAPKVFGGRFAPTLTGLPGTFFNHPREFRFIRHAVEGDECILDAIRAGSRISHFPFRIFHP